ncbi:MAG: hypothetical protein R3F20_12745 [Planctomycetota bacterium]
MAQAPELSRRAAAQVEPEEGRRGDEDGDALLGDGAPDAGGVERRGMGDEPEAGRDREPVHEEAEGVEEREAPQHDLVRGEREDARDLGDVRGDLGLLEDDALRRAAAAAREEEGRRVVRPDAARRAGEALDERARQEQHRERGRAPGEEPAARDEVGDLEDATVRRQLETEGPQSLRRGDDVPGAGAREDVVEGGRPEPRIQRQERAAAQARGERDERGRGARREEHRDRFAFLEPGREPAPEQERAGRERDPREAAIAVDDRDPPRRATRRVQRSVVERRALAVLLAPGLALELEDGVADLGGRGLRRQRRAEGDAHATSSSGEAREGDPAPRREERPRQALDVRRDHGGAAPLRHPLEAALEGEETAEPADLTLGEDADELPVRERLPGVAQRAQERGGGTLRVHRDHAVRIEQPAEGGALVVAPIDDGADGTPRAEAEEPPVHEGDVVADDERAALARDAILAPPDDAIEEGTEDEEEGASGRTDEGEPDEDPARDERRAGVDEADAAPGGVDAEGESERRGDEREEAERGAAAAGTGGAGRQRRHAGEGRRAEEARLRRGQRREQELAESGEDRGDGAVAALAEARGEPGTDRETGDGAEGEHQGAESATGKVRPGGESAREGRGGAERREVGEGIEGAIAARGSRGRALRAVSVCLVHRSPLRRTPVPDARGPRRPR